MKKIRRIVGLILTMMLALAMATTAFAQDVPTGKAGNGSITITNAAKGETYSLFKLFDASVSEDGGIVYTGTIPDSLKDYFTANAAGEITMKDGATELSADAIVALKAWAATQTTDITAVSDGSQLTFTQLQYGYYVITSTQNSGAAITVDSTNPSATVTDKNTTEPNIGKKVDDANVEIGQTVTYTVTANTANFLTDDQNDSHKVVKYEIIDTLPDFLSDVTVTSVKVGNTTITPTPSFVNKTIAISWVDAGGNHIYGNGDDIVITYTAKVTDKAVVDGDGNTNTVTLKPYVDDPENPKPWDEEWEDNETIKTYAVALKKVDENSKALAGATFYVNGLTVTGSNGEYTVVSYDAASTAKGTIMSTDERGYLIVKGLPSDITLQVYEEAAPKGYNKLTAPQTWNPVVINETVTTSQGKIYYDEEGNVTDQVTTTSINVVNFNEKIVPLALEIKNSKGSELPSTGGIGTTIFYVIGGLLVLVAGVILVTRRRMETK